MSEWSFLNYQLMLILHQMLTYKQDLSYALKKNDNNFSVESQVSK